MYYVFQFYCEIELIDNLFRGYILNYCDIDIYFFGQFIVFDNYKLRNYFVKILKFCDIEL